MKTQIYTGKVLVRNPRTGSANQIMADIELTIKWGDLFEYLARKASANASNRTSQLKGMVKAKITKMHHTA